MIMRRKRKAAGLAAGGETLRSCGPVRQGQTHSCRDVLFIRFCVLATETGFVQVAHAHTIVVEPSLSFPLYVPMKPLRQNCSWLALQASHSRHDPTRQPICVELERARARSTTCEAGLSRRVHAGLHRSRVRRKHLVPLVCTSLLATRPRNARPCMH